MLMSILYGSWATSVALWRGLLMIWRGVVFIELVLTWLVAQFLRQKAMTDCDRTEHQSTTESAATDMWASNIDRVAESLLTITNSFTPIC